jgi:hypothetical protein
MEGGCACGAVRYRLNSKPYDAGYCHCTSCRRAAAAPVVAFATVPFEALVITHGQPAQRRSSSFGERWFCQHCGTQLAMRVDPQPTTIDFTIGSLDKPENVPPEFHIWFADRIGWFNTGDALDRHQAFRPETPGLEKGDVK